MRRFAAVSICLLPACACPTPHARLATAPPPRAISGDLGSAPPSFDGRGLSFTVSTEAGRTRFRAGEPIVLRLVFASNRPRQYRLDAGTYDRSGRMQCDRYEWTPRAGAVDPLAEWFAGGFGEMGGLRTMPVLGPEPVVVERDLGEHVRFDAPGRYELVVRTDRVDSDAGPVPLTAPPVSIEIVAADATWAAQQLADATRALDEAAGTEARVAAARRLRFLATPEATRAMATRLANAMEGEGTFDLMLGVAGSPHRALGEWILEDALVAPDAAIDGTALELLGFLRRVRTPDPAGTSWLEARRRVLEDLEARLAAAWPDKRGPRPRAVTFATLLEAGLRRRPGPAWLAPLLARLPEMMPTLPAEAQQRLLAYRWRSVRAPALVPVLRATAAAAQSPSLRAHALRRLVELDPAAGRSLVIEEVRAAPIRLGPEWRVALLSLPRGPIAGLDEDLMRAVERRDHELEQRAELLARYGSPALRARVQAVLADRPGDLTSEAQGSLLGWLARLDPAPVARSLEVGLAAPDLHVRFALAASRVLREAPGAAAIEAVLVRCLDDADPNLAIPAAEALADAGSARVRQALEERLARWRTTWRPRAGELVSSVAEESPHADEVRLEVALGGAIARGNAWLASHAEIVRLRAEAVTDWARQDLDGAVSETNGPPVITARFDEDGSLAVRVAQAELASIDALRARLALYPRGARFRLEVPDGGTPEEVAALRRASSHVTLVP